MGEKVNLSIKHYSVLDQLISLENLSQKDPKIKNQISKTVTKNLSNEDKNHVPLHLFSNPANWCLKPSKRASKHLHLFFSILAASLCCLGWFERNFLQVGVLPDSRPSLVFWGDRIPQLLCLNISAPDISLVQETRQKVVARLCEMSNAKICVG